MKIYSTKLSKKKLVYLKDIIFDKEDIVLTDEIYVAGKFCDEDYFLSSKNNLLETINKTISEKIKGIDAKIIIDLPSDHIDCELISMIIDYDDNDNMFLVIEKADCKVVGTIKNRKNIVQVDNEFYSFNKNIGNIFYRRNGCIETVIPKTDLTDTNIDILKTILENLNIYINTFNINKNINLSINKNRNNYLNKFDEFSSKFIKTKKTDCYYRIDFNKIQQEPIFKNGKLNKDSLRIGYIEVINKKISDIIIPYPHTKYLNISLLTPILSYDIIEEALENFVYWDAEEDYIFKINEGDKNECIESIECIECI